MRFDQELVAYGQELFAQQVAAYRARPRRSYHFLRSLRVRVGVTLLGPIQRRLREAGRRLLPRGMGRRARLQRVRGLLSRSS